MVPKSQLPVQGILRAVPHEAPGGAAGRRRVGAHRGVPVRQADVPVVQNEVGVIVLQLLLILGSKEEESAVKLSQNPRMAVVMVTEQRQRHRVTGSPAL